ncbi:hypothetical protein LguiA_007513 [Lonicera macranthoides]
MPARNKGSFHLTVYGSIACARGRSFQNGQRINSLPLRVAELYRILLAGAVKHLVKLIDPAVGMVYKAVAVLLNLVTIPEGRPAIGQEGAIPFLVKVI